MKVLFSVVASIILFTSVGQASIFGEENALLAQIYQNAIQQLIQLQSILGTAQGNLALLSQVNRGINDGLALLQIISPDTAAGLYDDWVKVQVALGKISSIYGTVVPSTEAPLQTDTDREIAEAITQNNAMYKFSDSIETVSRQLGDYNNFASPGRAQQLTAQSLRVMLNVMNVGLKAQATQLKLTAQNLALQNHKDKETTRATLKQADILQGLMKEEPVTYETPRF